MQVRFYNTRHASREEVMKDYCQQEMSDVPRIGDPITIPTLTDGAVTKVHWLITRNAPALAEVFVR
jgi:hypothetical protein